MRVASLRQKLIQIAMEWQKECGVAPSITSAISEYDAAKIVGMSDEEYSIFMQDRTAVSKDYDFIYKGLRYQVKARRPSGRPGSFVTNAGKARNYNWDVLIWILYNTRYEIEEAWMWDAEKYKKTFDAFKRISPDDMRKGKRMNIST